MSPDYGSFFNAAAALFPILVLTKTVSLRNRSAVTPSSSAQDKDPLKRLRHDLNNGSTCYVRHPYFSQGGHVLHILVASAGEALALIALWNEGGHSMAIAVATLLGIAAALLVVELMIDAFRM